MMRAVRLPFHPQNGQTHLYFGCELRPNVRLVLRMERQALESDRLHPHIGKRVELRGFLRCDNDRAAIVNTNELRRCTSRASTNDARVETFPTLLSVLVIVGVRLDSHHRRVPYRYVIATSLL
jgi:hypothetical protein